MPAPPRFNGTDGISAARWLRSLTYTLHNGLSPAQWLTAVDMFLTGDAALWADTHPCVRKILTAEHLPRATKIDVETFKKAILSRFPDGPEVDTHELETQIATLEQGPLESVKLCYQRAKNMLHLMGGVDLDEAPLSIEEEEVLRRVGDEFILGLRHGLVKDILMSYAPRFVEDIGNTTLGLEELRKAAEMIEENIRLKDEIFRAEPKGKERSGLTTGAIQSPGTAPSSIVLASSPPELNFNGLSGSLGSSHDSFTRSKYGMHSDEDAGAVVIIGPKGIACIEKEAAKLAR